MYQETRSVGIIDPVSAMAFASTVQKNLPVLTNLFNSIFGGGSQYSTGVKWLTSYYQYYVMGDAGSTGSTKAVDANTPTAQSWFSTVLGVPIYDRYRLHALMGTDYVAGADLHKSDAQKAADFLAFEDVQDQDPKAVAQAVQIAKQFKWGTPPGSWKQFGITAPAVTQPTVDPYTGTQVPPAGGYNPPTTQHTPDNTLLIGGAIALGLILLLGNKK